LTRATPKSAMDCSQRCERTSPVLNKSLANASVRMLVSLGLLCRYWSKDLA